MTKTKLNPPRPARSLAAILAITFFILSMAVLLVTGGIGLYGNSLTNQDALSSKQQLIALDAAKTVASSIEQKFTGLELAVELVDPVFANTDTQKSYLESLMGHDPAFRQIALLNSAGSKVAGVSRLSAISSSSSQFDAQLKAEDVHARTKDGQRYISPVYIDNVTSEPLIVIAVPAKNAFGDFQGTLVAEVNLKFMWDLVDQLQVGQTGYAYVVDNKGNLIAFGDTSRVLRSENVQQIYEVKEFIQNPSASTDTTPEVANYTGLLGKTVVGIYVPLGTPEWAVVTELPTDEAYQNIITQSAFAGLSVLIMAILAGVAGIFMARRLAIPLVNLTKTASRIAGGEVDLQAAVAGAQEFATLATAFNTMTAQLRELIGSLEQRVTNRTKALATSSEVSRRLSMILNQKELVTEVVDQVNNAFGYYHTQIYFYDEAGENLVMAGGTGEAGEKMLAQFHKIAKGRGLVGRAAESNETMLVSNTSQNPEWLPNPLLPETKAEIVIPIAIGKQVLGVLDVQHNITDGLQREDVESLQSIANQVAVALQNIRQYESTRKIAADMGVVASVGIATSTITETGKLLQEVVDLSKKSFNLYHAHIYLLNEAGDVLELASGAGEVGRQMVSEKRSIPLDSEKSLVARAARTRTGVVVNDVTLAPDFLPNPLLPDTRSEMAVPMVIADKVVGVLDVQSETANRFTEVDISIQTTLAAQIAGALQNARSLTQSQRNTERETAVNLITQKIQGTTSIEAALKIAARELGHALGMRQTRVELDSTALADKHKSNS